MLGYVNSSSRAEVRDFLERVSKTLRAYDDLDSQLPIAASTSFSHAATKVDDTLVRYQEPFRLAVVGEFNAGKSALINALLGRAGLLLEGVTPTTGARTELWWGETESGVVYDGSGEKLFEGPLDEVVPYTDQRTASGRGISGKGAKIVLRVNSDLLKQLIIIDTPGLGANPRDDQVTLDSLHLADAALLVVNGLQPGGEDSLSLSERLRTTGRRVMVVVSRLDQANDPADSMAAVKDLLGDITDGEPIAVVAPAVTAALTALGAAEESGDGEAAERARETLAESGYDILRERLEVGFLSGDAPASRAVSTLSEAVKHLTQLLGNANQIVARNEETATRIRDEMAAGQRHVRETLMPKVPYIAQKIDEAVDIHVGTFVNDLSDAVALYIDKLATGGVKVGVRSLTAITDRQKERLRHQLRREFEEIFPPRHLDITIEQITRSVHSAMETEWSGATLDLSQRIDADRFDATLVVKQVADQVARVTASLGADLVAFILLLFVPGGVLVDLALLFLFSGIGGLHRSRLPDRVALAKRDARLRIRLQRRVLTNQLSSQYREVNTRTAGDLIQRATDESSARQAEHAELMRAQDRWASAVTDMQRLLDGADELAGAGGHG